ncbi:GNAT family N-acetyltransferase [Paenibacillus sp. PDC88]|uniref:GNAT family N-acetyltransferase n=1 Tax=Paenibacillus sp. PDC88 TaxID=1884375 RepID=UPI00089C7A24|nr:GNAT family N-acetyltransferase [Paenibacillus sp. PDC88]SDX46207.1 transcriptional regulator, AraC family [Paenibacillus sp. PDC88]
MNTSNLIITTINYIEDHLTEKLNLDVIANALHYSKYYLHRIFSKRVGMTIHEYVQRRQLTEAAKLLAFSNKPILDIAILAGYDSQQAFTTIFKAMYKKTPLQFREDEQYYALQLRFRFDDEYFREESKKEAEFGKKIRFASEKDVDAWMNLVRLVIDGYPYLYEEEHMKVLRKCIAEGRAFIMTEGDTVIGNMMISYARESIDFLGVHPLYRKQGIAKLFMEVVISEWLKINIISITTFREGDKADTGYRKALKELGFAEAELLTEFGYPTQRMVLHSKQLERGYNNDDSY